MGTALAERLLDHGYPVRVWNRNREEGVPRCLARGAALERRPGRGMRPGHHQPLFERSRRGGDRPAHAGSPRGARSSSTPRPGEPARERGDGAQTLGGPGRAVSRRAPISGSSEQTRPGRGDGDRRRRPRGVRGVVPTSGPCSGGTVFHVGGWGDAARMKLASNLVLGLNRAALAEGLAFAEAIGLDPAAAPGGVRRGAWPTRGRWT